MHETINQLVTTFTSNLSSTFNRIYYGRPKDDIARGHLPALIVYPVSSTHDNSGTVRDRNTFEIGIEIVDSIKRYMTTSGGVTNTGMQQLIKWVEEQDSGTYKTGTIMQILRDNITVGGNVLFSGDYGIDYTFDQENDIIKASLVFTCEKRLNRT